MAQLRSISKLRLLASEIDDSISNINKDVQEASPYNIIHVGLSMVNVAKDLKIITPVSEEGKMRRDEIQAWIDLYLRRFQSTVGKHAI